MSAARRSDQVAKAKVLRTKERPEGFGDEATKMANLLADQIAALAEEQWARGRYFSIENPEGSILWMLKSYIRLAAKKGVRFIRIDQCAAGSGHKKPTLILTNAP